MGADAKSLVGKLMDTAYKTALAVQSERENKKDAAKLNTKVEVESPKEQAGYDLPNLLDGVHGRLAEYEDQLNVPLDQKLVKATKIMTHC